MIPKHPGQIRVKEVDLRKLRKSYLQKALSTLPDQAVLNKEDIAFLVEDSRAPESLVREILQPAEHQEEYFKMEHTNGKS
ncbi:hypothetical protein ES703_100464 [subsurface metagenome]